MSTKSFAGRVVLTIQDRDTTDRVARATMKGTGWDSSVRRGRMRRAMQSRNAGRVG
jgi:hypothetical protein